YLEPAPVPPGGAVPPGAAAAHDLGDGRFVALASGSLVLMRVEGDALTRLDTLTLPGDPDGLVAAGSRILVALQGSVIGDRPTDPPVIEEDPYGARGDAHLGLVEVVGDELVLIRGFALSGSLTRL